MFPYVGVLQLVPLCSGLAVRNGRSEGVLQRTVLVDVESVGVGKETIVASLVT